MVLAISSCSITRNAPAEPPTAGPHPLRKSLRTYFGESDPGKRTALLPAITAAANGSVRDVASALAETALWEPIDRAVETLSIECADHRPSDLRVTLPADYDPKDRHPLILALLERGGTDGKPDDDWLATFRTDFIIARATDFAPLTFNGPRARADEPRRWLGALRRRYHIDTDRVYLYGRGLGGDAAFLTGIMQADLFAGIIVREGMLDLPYHRELQTILLQNLSVTPLHLIWTKPDLPTGTVLTGRSIKVALANQSTVAHAARAGLPITHTVLSPESTTTVGVWHHILQHRRPRNTLAVSHWFRYPEQGRTRFLRTVDCPATVWEGDQLDVRVQPTVDRSAFISDVLRSKLANVQLSMAEQTIVITTTRCDTIELELGLDALDWSQPVHLKVNGKRRLSERLRPAIATLLESAYQDWEFQHPACLRLRIGKKGRVRAF